MAKANLFRSELKGGRPAASRRSRHLHKIPVTNPGSIMKTESELNGARSPSTTTDEERNEERFEVNSDKTEIDVNETKSAIENATGGEQNEPLDFSNKPTMVKCAHKKKRRSSGDANRNRMDINKQNVMNSQIQIQIPPGSQQVSPQHSPEGRMTKSTVSDEEESKSRHAEEVTKNTSNSRIRELLSQQPEISLDRAAFEEEEARQQQILAAFRGADLPPNAGERHHHHHHHHHNSLIDVSLNWLGMNDIRPRPFKSYNPPSTSFYPLGSNYYMHQLPLITAANATANPGMPTTVIDPLVAEVTRGLPIPDVNPETYNAFKQQLANIQQQHLLNRRNGESSLKNYVRNQSYISRPGANTSATAPSPRYSYPAFPGDYTRSRVSPTEHRMSRKNRLRASPATSTGSSTASSPPGYNDIHTVSSQSTVSVPTRLSPPPSYSDPLNLPKPFNSPPHHQMPRPSTSASTSPYSQNSSDSFHPHPSPNINSAAANKVESISHLLLTTNGGPMSGSGVAVMNRSSTATSPTDKPTTVTNGSGRKRSRGFPEELKDDVYWERRRKNNEAAKRSRDARRAKEDGIALRAAYLERENLQLRLEVARLKEEIRRLKYLIYRRQCPN